MIRNYTATANITYRQYVSALAAMQNPNAEVAFWFSGTFSKLKEAFEGFAATFNIAVKDVIEAFKAKPVYRLLKAVGFNLGKLLSSVVKAGEFLRSKMLAVFRTIGQSGVIQKLREGAVTVDQFLDEYPMLKKITGPIMAGLLLYVWLSMSFIGSAGYDLDITYIVNAFTGSFSVKDLFASDSGLMMLTLFGVGSLTGLSFPWLGGSVSNLLLAILYTSYKNTGKPAFVKKFANQIMKKRY